MEQANVLEFERPEMEDQSEGVEVAVNVRNRKDLLVGAGAGFATAAAIFGTGWFLERHSRLKVLKELEIVLVVVEAISTGKDVVMFGKKEIDAAGKVMATPQELILDIQERLDTVKLWKSEKKRWKNTLAKLLEAAIALHTKEKIMQIKEADNSKMTETLVEN